MKDTCLIPYGSYCKNCPYWSLDKSKPYQRNGYCNFLERGDWEIGENSWDSLLWDKVKECNINVHISSK